MLRRGSRDYGGAEVRAEVGQLVLKWGSSAEEGQLVLRWCNGAETKQLVQMLGS